MSAFNGRLIVFRPAPIGEYERSRLHFFLSCLISVHAGIRAERPRHHYRYRVGSVRRCPSRREYYCNKHSGGYQVRNDHNRDRQLYAGADGHFDSSAPYYNDYRQRRRPQESIGVSRSFRFKESMALMVRMEFSNVLNRTSLPNPISTNFLATRTLSPTNGKT